MKINQSLAFRRVGGEMFVVDSSRALLHELNGPAAVIWEGLTAGLSRERIISAVTAEFEIDSRTAGADFDGFTAELRKAGLVI